MGAKVAEIATVEATEAVTLDKLAQLPELITRCGDYIIVRSA
ncbi:hypothetical protein [Paenibacillus qinlingensis]|nr:hypothetical protein [Paenibacillus qinlingensis]